MVRMVRMPASGRTRSSPPACPTVRSLRTIRRESCGSAVAIFSPRTVCARWRPAALDTIRAMAAASWNAMVAITREPFGAGCLDRSPWLRTGDATAALAVLESISDALEDQGLGTIGEIFEGDPPHHPRGAPAQAWSVGCTLDAWRLLSQALHEKQRQNGPESQAAGQGPTPDAASH